MAYFHDSIPRHPAAPRQHARRSSRPYYPPEPVYYESQPAYYPPAPPAAPQTPAFIKFLLTLFYLSAAAAMLIVVVAYAPAALQVWSDTPAVTVATQPPARPHAPPVAQQQPAAPAVAEAPAAQVEAQQPPAPMEAPAPLPADAPPAVIAVQPPPAIVEPVAPARIAIESQAQPTAPAPTVATTAPMLAGKDFTYNPEQTCVYTVRGADKVQYCQVSEMSMGAMSSVADFLRTGRIPGEIVQP